MSDETDDRRKVSSAANLEPINFPPCVLCGKLLTAFGEMQDCVCAGRPGEDIALSCSVRLQKWMKTSEFAEAFQTELGRPDWVKSSWRVAIDYWQERGRPPPI